MDKRIQKAQDFIKKNYKKKILIDEIARKVGLSPFHFKRLFKVQMKETPKEFLINLRLIRAGALLKINPKLTKAQVAAECGYPSLGSFSRAFAKKFGVSPSDFLKTKSRKFIENPSLKKLEVEVVNFPGAWIFYSCISVKDEKLLHHFESTRFACELAGYKCATAQRIGFLTQTVFHGPKDILNYYTGIKIELTGQKINEDRLFQIPAGKYARFETSFPCSDPWGILTQFVTEWLKHNPFVFSDIFAFEEIASDNKLSQYPSLKRTIYYPIRQR